jgi:hypothetical protein
MPSLSGGPFPSPSTPRAIVRAVCLLELNRPSCTASKSRPPYTTRIRFADRPACASVADGQGGCVDP